MAANEPKTQDEKVRTLDRLIRDIEVAMLTTADPSGRLYARPMHAQGGLDDGCLYFFTMRQSPKVEDIRQDAQVNCAFAKPGADEYVSVAGTAGVTDDRALMERKWDPTLKAWLPQGLDTPGVCLIRVKVSDAQYWDTRQGAMMQLYGTVKAALTGEPVKDVGDVQKVRL